MGMTNEERFVELFRKYKDRVYAVAFRRLKSESEAEDICQETFKKMFEKLDLGMEDEKIKAWLMVVADNAAKDILRKGGRYRQVYVAGEELETGGMRRAAGNEAYEELLRADFRVRILEELRRHNKEQYEVMVCVCCMGLRMEEVAEQMGLDYRQVVNRLHRARSWLREHYREEYNELRH